MTQVADVFYIAYLLGAILSAVSSMFVIIVYYRFKILQVFAFRLVRDLAFFGFLNSLAWALPPSPAEICILQGVLLSFTSLLPVLWTTVISTILLLRIKYHMQISEDLYEKYSLFVVVFIALLLTVLPFCSFGTNGNLYGDTGGWCWIKQTDHTEFAWVWRFVAFYIPFFLVLIYNSIANTVVARTVYKTMQELPWSHEAKTFVIRLALYPFILMVSYFPVTILRLYHNFVGFEAPPLLTLIAGLLCCLNGMLNALIYGINKSVRQALCNRHVQRDTASILLDSSA